MENYTTFIGDNQSVYIKCLIHNQEAPNIIFLMTPIGSIEDDLAIANYKPFLEGGFNLFAIDLPGIGNSTNDHFTYTRIKSAILSLVKMIHAHYSDTIHLYGGTGTGGIIAQALASDPDIPHFKSLSQLGVVNHGDLSIIGDTRILTWIYPVLGMMVKFFPKYRIKFKVPKYNGYNAEKENNWYRSMMEKYPGIFDLSLEIVYTLLWLMLSADSPLKSSPNSPTLVMASKYDRYYKEDYVNRYYQNLNQRKAIHWIEDSHCVFAWRPEELVYTVSRWVEEIERDY